MKSMNNQISVVNFLCVSIILIYFLYINNIFKNIQCNNTLSSQMTNILFHQNIFHIISNILGLYGLTYIEQKIGKKKFIILLIYLIICNSIIEVILNKITDNNECSIGLSGVIIGVFVWNKIVENDINKYLLLSITYYLLMPFVKPEIKITFNGHIAGVISGIIGGFFFNYFKQ